MLTTSIKNEKTWKLFFISVLFYIFASEIMEQKNKFLEKALALFLENGAKTLTMDDIAREFGMSKRTIYQHYKNKEELLDSVLDFHTDMVISKLKAITEIENLNSVEKMLIRDEDLQKLSNNQKSIFIRQVKKYYSNLSKKNAIKAYEKLKTIFISNIEQGQKEGLYRKNIDVEVVVKMVIVLMFSYDESPLMESANADSLNQCEFSKQVIKFYLNAIVTEEGRKFL